MQPHYPLYLASVTPIHDLEIILDHLQIRSYFKDVYGCPPWTKDRCGVSIFFHTKTVLAQNAVLIGDSYGDQRTAKRNGHSFHSKTKRFAFSKIHNLKPV
jgi:phosphoglycolate phosphatase-like HAD superfamily hydrolase